MFLRALLCTFHSKNTCQQRITNSIAYHLKCFSRLTTRLKISFIFSFSFFPPNGSLCVLFVYYTVAVVHRIVQPTTKLFVIYALYRVFILSSRVHNLFITFDEMKKKISHKMLTTSKSVCGLFYASAEKVIILMLGDVRDGHFNTFSISPEVHRHFSEGKLIFSKH